VPGALQPHREIADDHPLPELDRLQARERAARLVLGVQGAGRPVPGDPLAVGVCGILLMDAPAVGEEDAEQIAGRRGAEDRPPIALAHYHRKVAAVIDVGVRHHDRVEAGRLEPERLPVPKPQLLESLEQPAVDQDSGAGRLDQELRTGYRAGAAEEAELHPPPLFFELRRGESP
jgi:hypothetical protein